VSLSSAFRGPAGRAGASRRVWQHKQGLIEGFSRRYNVQRLVYSESFQYVRDAVQREKRLKKWNREWKIRLTESVNPEWNDLSESLIGMP